MDLVRDAWAYAVRLARQPIGSLLAAVAFILALVSAVEGHSIALAPWAWALVAEGSLVLAGFLDWRASQTVPEEHARMLREIVISVHDSVASNNHAKYLAGGRSDEHVRTVFQDHFPEFTDSLREWESLPGAIASAKVELGQLIDSTWGERWQSRQGWASQEARKACINIVDRRLSEPSPIDLSPGNYFLLTYNLHGLMIARPGGGTVFSHFDSEDPVAADQANRDVQDLNAWVVEMHASAPADKWRRLTARKEEARVALRDGLQPFIHAPALKKRRCGRTCREL